MLVALKKQFLSLCGYNRKYAYLCFNEEDCLPDEFEVRNNKIFTCSLVLLHSTKHSAKQHLNSSLDGPCTLL